MKILITGANGTIGTFLVNRLKDHDVFTPKSCSVDFTIRYEVDNFFNSHSNFDVVFHCAIKGGSRLRQDDWNVLDDNLRMHYNLLHHKNKFKKFITFGSGAEIFMSDQPYGLSKKVIAKSILGNDNLYNIRIYGLFGEGELETRFIRSALTNYINNQPIQIHQNKFMDFFYMEDLWTLLKYYIDTKNPPKEVDCSYDANKRSLESIAKQINKLANYEVPINNLGGFTTEYVGEETILNSLPISLIGFEKGLQLEYEKYKLK
jgi:UDP-glucose 4-epimerase